MATANVKLKKLRPAVKALPVRSALRVRNAPASRTIRELYGLGQRLFARLLGIPATSLARLEKSDAMPLDTRAKLRAVTALLRELSRVIPKTDLARWLTTPNGACLSAGRRTPADMIAKGRYDQVEAIIYFFKSGAAF